MHLALALLSLAVIARRISQVACYLTANFFLTDSATAAVSTKVAVQYSQRFATTPERRRGAIRERRSFLDFLLVLMTNG